MHYELATKNYPQTVIQYLSKNLTVKTPEEKPTIPLHPMLDCDNSSSSPESRAVPVYFKLKGSKKDGVSPSKSYDNGKKSKTKPKKIE